MLDLFSDDVRRDPYPIYEQLRSHTPIVHIPPPFDLWMVLDFEEAPTLPQPGPLPAQSSAWMATARRWCPCA